MPDASSPRPHLARIVLVAFVLTFLAARVLVLLIMSRRLPDLYLHVGQTHVHHLNYGIFLLSGVGAYLLAARPTDAGIKRAAALYGIGLALTFDEFGLWLHLGGSYWQRASYDAVVAIASILLLATLAPAIRKTRPRHWIALTAIIVLSIIFAALQAEAIQRVGWRAQQQLQTWERTGPK